MQSHNLFSTYTVSMRLLQAHDAYIRFHYSILEFNYAIVLSLTLVVDNVCYSMRFRTHGTRYW